MQGEFYLPLMEIKNNEYWWKSIYYHYYEYHGPPTVKRHYGIRTEKYKLIHFYNDFDQWELYDLKNDLTEINSLFGKEGFEEITESLYHQIVFLQKENIDTTTMIKLYN